MSAKFCIRQTCPGKEHLAHCGQPMADEEYLFPNVDYAVYHNVHGGQLPLCPNCYKVIQDWLLRGTKIDGAGKVQE